MRKITLADAKRLAKKYLLDGKIKQGRYLYNHTKNVVEVSKIISKKYNLKSENLEISGWLHDIGYFLENEKPHAENSIFLIKEEGFELNERITDCILNHGSKKTPKTAEGKIVQIADKLSFIDKKLLKNLISEGVTAENVTFVENILEDVKLMLQKLKDL